MESCVSFWNAIQRAFGFSIPFADPKSYPVLPADGVPWNFASVSSRVVAVGDVQGDLQGLDAILQAAQLTDASGNWMGGNSVLVLLGDLVGGNKDSRLVIEWVLRLEREASRSGGKVISLLGNHDILPSRGDVSKMTGAERSRYRNVPVPGAEREGAKGAFRGDSLYAKWVRGRNAIVRVGTTLFAHAGVESWLEENDPGGINATVRGWVKHWQGVGPRPDESTVWAAGAPGMKRFGPESVGPLWNRTFKPPRKRDHKRPDGAPKRETVERVLKKLGANRVVVGHAPTPEAEILLEHPYYGPHVVMVDTKLSDSRSGSLEALEVRGDVLSVIRAKQKNRSEAASVREAALLERGMEKVGLWERIKQFFLDWFGN